jgi:hypothetical protein
MPADADVIEGKPGKCPKCGMTLTPIRLDTTWTCPVHAAVHRETGGKCPIDGRDLIQVTMSISWACRGADARSLEPKTCPDGSPMVKQYVPRPHGNHNPQHGGQFFMAPDNWHHLEGTFPRAGVFRMYLYDDYTKPLPHAQEREILGEIAIRGRRVPLVLAANGRYLEAKIANVTVPAAMQATLKFKTGGQSSVFDFNFETYSRDVGPSTSVATRAAPAATLGTAPASPAVPAAPPTAAATPLSIPADVSTGVDPAFSAQPIPNTVPEMLAQLRARTDQIRGLIDKGSFGEVYVPAFQAKDLAVALEAHESELPADRREIAEPAIATLVRAAYLLDAFGDLGNKQQISAAFEQFATAENHIVSAFPQR